MPAFHIHGLVWARLSHIAAGAAVFSTGGFETFRFHAGIKESGATWRTAAVTMYQAILARAGGRASRDATVPLSAVQLGALTPLPLWGTFWHTE
jgi:acyl-CoA synthetase (AMP-forming)/AMP-acid ligase II